MKGKVWKYGDHVNTDVIIPGRYLDDYDLKNMAKHAMEDLDPKFAKDVTYGDIIIAGRNFGCGFQQGTGAPGTQARRRWRGSGDKLRPYLL